MPGAKYDICQCMEGYTIDEDQVKMSKEKVNSLSLCGKKNRPKQVFPEDIHPGESPFIHPFDLIGNGGVVIVQFLVFHPGVPVFLLGTVFKGFLLPSILMFPVDLFSLSPALIGKKEYSPGPQACMKFSEQVPFIGIYEVMNGDAGHNEIKRSLLKIDVLEILPDVIHLIRVAETRFALLNDASGKIHCCNGGFWVTLHQHFSQVARATPQFKYAFWSEAMGHMGHEIEHHFPVTGNGSFDQGRIITADLVVEIFCVHMLFTTQILQAFFNGTEVK